MFHGDPVVGVASTLHRHLCDTACASCNNANPVSTVNQRIIDKRRGEERKREREREKTKIEKKVGKDTSRRRGALGV